MSLFLILGFLLATFAAQEMTICYRKDKTSYGATEIIDEQPALIEMKQAPFSCEGPCPCTCLKSDTPIRVSLATMNIGLLVYLHVDHSEEGLIETIVSWGDETEDVRYVLEKGRVALSHKYEEEKEYDIATSFDGRCHEQLHEKIKVNF